MLSNYLAKVAGACLLALLPTTGLALAQSSAPQQPPQQVTAAKKKGPKAKSKEEYEAFLAVTNAPTARAAEASAKEFEAKYPKSELLSTLYEQVMGKYQEAENSDKVIDMGRKALQYNPDNAVALVMIGTVMAESTRATDIDRDDKLKEATDDANRALRAVQTGNFYLGANATPDQTAAFTDMVTYMAVSALGRAELLRSNFAAAEEQLRKAVKTQRGSADATNWLRLAEAQEGQKKYSDALSAANKAAALAPPNSPLANAAKAAQARLQQQAAASSK